MNQPNEKTIKICRNCYAILLQNSPTCPYCGSHSIHKNQVTELINPLSERERKILELRYGLKDNTRRTLAEIGKIFNLSRERIRQIETKAINKLKANIAKQQ